MTSPAKRQRLVSVLTESLEDLDTELKAICYDITINNGAQAIKSIEKVRRKLKATEGKLKTLNKVEIAENTKLIKENMELQKEIYNLKTKIEEFEDDQLKTSHYRIPVPLHVLKNPLVQTPARMLIYLEL